MFKLLFELFTDPFSLPINPIYEYIILSIIGIIAYKVAWNESPGGKFGSLIHWTVRLVVFCVLWAIVDFLIAACQWMRNNWIIMICVLGGIVLLLIAISVIRKFWQKKHKEREVTPNETDEK